MPNIRSADTPALGLRPTEIGVEATAAAARRGGAFFNQAAQDYQTLGHEAGSALKAAGDVAVDYVAHHEISQGAANFANKTAELTDLWNNAAKNANPNDPTVAANFNEKVLNPALETFRDGFMTEKGQQWAEGHIDALRQHMYQKTTADMATLAGEAVTTNVRQMANAWTNTARNDPSATKFLLDQADASVAGVIESSPNLKGAAAAKVRMEVLEKTKEQIVKAAALGAIERAADPEKAAGEFAKWYPEYVNAQEIDQLGKAARYYRRINDSETRADRVQRDYEAKTDFNKKINELEAATMPQNVGDAPQLPKDYWAKLRDLATHPGAAQEPGRLKTMVTNGEAITARLDKPEPLARTSHAATMDLLKRIRSTDDSRLTDNGPIYDAYQEGRLTSTDFNFLNREFGNLRSPEGQALDSDRKLFMGRYAKVIDGAMNDAGMHSLLGTQRTYEFEMEARRIEADLRKKGLDPHLAYDPRSEYFLGKPENVLKFRVSLQESQAYEKTLKGMEAENAKPKPDGNLTGPDKTITRVDVIDIPAGMSPAEAMKLAKGKNAGKVRLPDGRTFEVSQ